MLNNLLTSKAAKLMLLVGVVAGCATPTPEWIMKHERAHCNGYGHDEMGNIDYSHRIWPPLDKIIIKHDRGALERSCPNALACTWRIADVCYILVD